MTGASSMMTEEAQRILIRLRRMNNSVFDLYLEKKLSRDQMLRWKQRIDRYYTGW